MSTTWPLYARVAGSRDALAGHAPPRDPDAEQQCWDPRGRGRWRRGAGARWLGAQGIRRGVCSNAPFPPEMMRRQVKSNGISELLVEAIVFSSETGRRKPAPEVYLSAVEAIGTDPGRTLFVGDRVREDYEDRAPWGCAQSS